MASPPGKPPLASSTEGLVFLMKTLQSMAQHTPHMCNTKHSHLSLCLLFKLVGNRPRFLAECFLEGVVGWAGEERGAASVLVLVVLGERGDEVSVVLGICAVEVLVIRT